MKLSMWDIYCELGYEDMLPMIQTGLPTIGYVRLLSSSHSNEETAYVGRAGEYFGTDSDDTVVVHKGDAIVVREVAIADVFDAVLDVLEEYTAWERLLDGMVEHEDGLQEMLDASDHMLHAPAFVYAPDGRAFALSSSYGPATHWHWAEILANRGITTGRFRSLRESIDLPEVWKDSHPKTRCSSIGAHAYMHCSLRPNGYMAGHFVLFAFEKPFRRGLERVADTLVRAMTRHMEHFYWLYSPTSQVAEVFSRFFDGGSLERSDVDIFLRALKWDFGDTYRVYVIRERTAKAPVLLSKLSGTVARRFPLAVSFVLDDELVILENETRSDSAERVAAQLSPLIGGDFHSGVSMSCEGIPQCRTMYAQAKREVRRCVDSSCRISRADENALACIREKCGGDELLCSYVHPELVKLRRYDDENDTHFYETLRAYTLANFHLSDAARYLGMHRNSLDYRLKRIRELIDFGVFDALASQLDEDDLMYVLLSFAVIDAHERAQE